MGKGDCFECISPVGVNMVQSLVSSHREGLHVDYIWRVQCSSMFEWFATQNTATEDLEVMVYLQLSLWIVVTQN